MKIEHTFLEMLLRFCRFCAGTDLVKYRRSNMVFHHLASVEIGILNVGSKTISTLRSHVGQTKAVPDQHIFLENRVFRDRNAKGISLQSPVGLGC